MLTVVLSVLAALALGLAFGVGIMLGLYGTYLYIIRGKKL